MKKAGCPKIWQAEALRDRKLTGKLQVEASNHIETCAICQHESEQLAILQHRLRSDTPVDALALRRLRAVTLTRANEQLHRQRLPKLAWLRIAAAGCGLAIALLVGLLLRKPAPSHGIQLQASATAVWTRSSWPGIEYVDLVDGMLSIGVTRSAEDPRLIVRVPDGEVEDTGTRFRVWVSGGRTREIGVESGSVLFRRSDANDVFVPAGSVWRAPENMQPSTPSSASPASSSPIEPKVTSSPGVSASERSRTSAMASRISKPKPIASGEAPKETGATDEDLAFLHIVALLHDSRDAEARLAARDYLLRYPDGFRRVEVLKLLESMGTSAP